VKHFSKLPIDTLWSLFTTKFNRDHNLEKPGDTKLPEQLKVFSTKVSEDIFNMFGGDKDYNYKKDMAPIASLVFAMKKERDEKVEQYNCVQKLIKVNKEMARKGKIALANYVLGEGETTNPHIKVPDVSQRSARLSSFITFDKVIVPTFNNDDHQGEEDDDSTSDYDPYQDNGNGKEKAQEMDMNDEGFTRDLDAAGNRVVRFSNGNVSFNPNNKTQNGIFIIYMIIDDIN
jgi:hypothetical protein